MRKTKFKVVAVTLLAGTVLQLGGGGCLNAILQEVAVRVVANTIGGFIPDFTGIIGG